jgi:hypothetical protein
MNSNTGDQSRKDLEARLDSILRESDPIAINAESRQPESVKTQPDFTRMEPAVEQPEISKKVKTKSISEYFRPLTKTFLQSIKSSRTWLMSLVKRPRKVTPPKLKSRFWNRVNKPLVFVLGSIGITAAVLLSILFNFSYLTVTNGIDTTLGTSDNRTVLTLKASDANQGSLIVASLGIDNETDQEILVIGTVFSKNDQSYALYDGEVIWQISAEQIRGIVLCAEATETP